MNKLLLISLLFINAIESNKVQVTINTPFMDKVLSDLFGNTFSLEGNLFKNIGGFQNPTQEELDYIEPKIAVNEEAFQRTFNNAKLSLIDQIKQVIENEKRIRKEYEGLRRSHANITQYTNEDEYVSHKMVGYLQSFLHDLFDEKFKRGNDYLIMHIKTNPSKMRAAYIFFVALKTRQQTLKII